MSVDRVVRKGIHKGEHLLHRQWRVSRAREVERKIKVVRIGNEYPTPMSYPSVKTGKMC